MLTRVVVALALVLSACTSSKPDLPEPPLPTALGDCEGPSPGPDPDYAGALAVPGEWVRLTAPVTLKMPEATARAVERALDRGATVHAHTDANTGEVAYAIAQHSGQHVFLGDCATALFTDPLRRKYGADYDRVVAGLIGETPGFIARALKGDPEYAVYLMRDRYAHRASDTPRGLSMVQWDGGFLVRGARAWDPGVALCLVTAIGVGGCARRSEDRVVTRTGLTYDPLDPVVEIALYERPSQRLIVVLAKVDIVEESRKAGFDPETDGVMLYADLPASPTLADVAADPSLAPRALKAVTVTPCRSAYCR